MASVLVAPFACHRPGAARRGDDASRLQLNSNLVLSILMRIHENSCSRADSVLMARLRRSACWLAALHDRHRSTVDRHGDGTGVSWI